MRALSVLLFVFVPCGCQQKSAPTPPIDAKGGRAQERQRPLYYRSIRIDASTLVAELVDPFPGGNPHPPNEPYYKYFHHADGFSIDHFSGGYNGKYAIRYNAFGADSNKRLAQRSKHQELVSGPFGTVFAETMYRYRDFFGDLRGSQFTTTLYSIQSEYEPARVVEKMPTPLPELSAISLVRVFKAPPEYLVTTANYGSDGSLRGFQVHASKSGDWVHPSNFGETMIEHSRRRERFGVPEKFPTTAYLESPGPIWMGASMPNTLNVISFHYDYNRWIRQDLYDSEAKRSTRFLTYELTLEDRILEPIDRSKPLGKCGRPNE